MRRTPLALRALQMLRAQSVTGPGAQTGAADLLTAFAGRLAAGIPARRGVRAVAGRRHRRRRGRRLGGGRGDGPPGRLRPGRAARDDATAAAAVAGRGVARHRVDRRRARPVVARLGDAARADARHRRAVDAELAAVRASTRVLGALPAVGLLMGTALGADPVRFLLGTEAGRCCLLGAGLLEWAGVRWTHAIADRARAAAVTVVLPTRVAVVAAALATACGPRPACRGQGARCVVVEAPSTWTSRSGRPLLPRGPRGAARADPDDGLDPALLLELLAATLAAGSTPAGSVADLVVAVPDGTARLLRPVAAALALGAAPAQAYAPLLDDPATTTGGGRTRSRDECGHSRRRRPACGRRRPA